MKTIKISNGTVKIQDFLPRGLQCDYSEKLFGDTTLGEQIKTRDFNSAKNFLVEKMVVEAEIKGVKMEINEEFVRNLDSIDFAKIFETCKPVETEKEEEDKKKQ